MRKSIFKNTKVVGVFYNVMSPFINDNNLRHIKLIIFKNGLG